MFTDQEKVVFMLMCMCACECVCLYTIMISVLLNEIKIPTKKWGKKLEGL